MNKQLANHEMMLKLVFEALNKRGITTNKKDAFYYVPIPRGKGYCHIELVGFTSYPILIKTAYAGDNSNNQAIRYLGQLEQVKDEVLFVYAGRGWNKSSHRKVLSAINRRLGIDHVLNLQQFEAWVKAKFEEKESR